MKNYKFIIKESPEYIDGEIFYKNNEFIFESKDGNGEFSLMIEKNDWRLQGQEEYLKGETLYYKNILNIQMNGNMNIVNSVVIK